MPTSTVRAEVGACNPRPQGTYYRRLPESALADRRLGRCALAVLARLDGYCRDKDHCWPSVASLMQELGYCRRSIQLALATLKAGGYLAERPADNPTGRVLVLLWRTPAPPPAQQPYSQGLPRERNRRAPEVKVRERSEGKALGSALRTPEPTPRRPPERPPTPEERAQAVRGFHEAMPPGSPIARVLEGRLRELGVPLAP